MEQGKKTMADRKAEGWQAFIGGADYRMTECLGRHLKLIVLIVLLVIVYIHNRYAAQQEQMEISRLKEVLKDTKYNALTISSELMERSRQSRIEEYVIQVETDLQIANQPPYLIK